MKDSANRLKQKVIGAIRDKGSEVFTDYGLLLVHDRTNRKFIWFDNWQQVAEYYRIG